MSSTVDVVEKLIQLALKNPNREEAASAALKAVALIDKFQIPIGADVTIIRDPAEDWKPPTADEMQAVEDLLKGRKNPDQPFTQQTSGQGYEGGIMIQDRETATAADAFRQRLVDAWRALREERKRLEGEVRRFEQETHRKFWGDGMHQRGW